VHGSVFREPTLGLTYDFPDKFSPKVESEPPTPFRDATGRERMMFTLWDLPQQGSALRMAFLYDTKRRSSDRTRDTIALAYIGEIKRTWLGVKDVTIAGPTKFPSRAMTIGGSISPFQIKCPAAIQRSLSRPPIDECLSSEQARRRKVTSMLRSTR
jgi:hypothetical protein